MLDIIYNSSFFIKKENKLTKENYYKQKMKNIIKK